jgi:hypothetical protein
LDSVGPASFPYAWRRLLMRMRLEFVRSRPGRLEGRLATEDGSTDVCFNGTLELLRLLEDLATDVDASDPEYPAAQRLDEHRTPRERT